MRPTEVLPPHLEGVPAPALNLSPNAQFTLASAQVRAKRSSHPRVELNRKARVSARRKTGPEAPGTGPPGKSPENGQSRPRRPETANNQGPRRPENRQKWPHRGSTGTSRDRPGEESGHRGNRVGGNGPRARRNAHHRGTEGRRSPRIAASLCRGFGVDGSEPAAARLQGLDPRVLHQAGERSRAGRRAGRITELGKSRTMAMEGPHGAIRRAALRHGAGNCGRKRSWRGPGPGLKKTRG